MRAKMLALALVTFLPMNIAAAAPDDASASPGSTDAQGLWITTSYPALSVRKGEAATIPLDLRNHGMPPTRLNLSVDGLPKGWTAEFRGGGQPVGAAMAPTDDSVALDLRLQVPASVEPGSYDLVVQATSGQATSGQAMSGQARSGQGGDRADIRLPLTVTVAKELPPKLSLEPEFPELVGTVSSSFDFRVALENDSGRDLLVNLGAEAPPGFTVSFTEGYGSQELTSIPVEAGQSKDIKASIDLPHNAAAGQYEVTVAAASEGVEARTTLGLEVTGEPTLSITGRDGRLSGEAVAGESSTLALVVANTGSAPAESVELSASPPSDWTVEFEPDTIDRIEPGAIAEVTATLTPASNAIAGDYMVATRAASEGGSDSADFRVTVRTPTVWGVAGVGVIVVALLVLFGAVLRFGRR